MTPGVVTAVGTSQPDHEGALERPADAGGHLRSTVRSRKWVAHEMHGS